jgi:predicted MFS family arabinose efflux permease
MEPPVARGERGEPMLAALCSSAFVALPRDPRPGRRRPGYGAMAEAYRPVLRDRPTVALIGAGFVRNTEAWLFFIYWGACLIERHGLDARQVGLGFTALGLGYSAGSLAAGWWPGRLPLRPLSAGLLGLSGVLLGAVLLLSMGPLLATALATWGFLMIGAAESTTTMLQVAEAPGSRAATTTLTQAATSLGTAAGGAVGGLLLATGGYPALSAALPLLGLAGLVLLRASRRRPHAVTGPCGVASAALSASASSRLDR